MMSKCKICGKDIPKGHGFKRPDVKSPWLCCDESEYQRWLKSKEDKSRVLKEIQDILGFPITFSLINKEHSEWNILASDEKIYHYLEDNKDYLCGCIAKLSGTNYGKIRYLSVIIQRSVGDYREANKVEEKVVKEIDNTMYDTFCSNNGHRRSLEELEEML